MSQSEFIRMLTGSLTYFWFWFDPRAFHDQTHLGFNSFFTVELLRDFMLIHIMTLQARGNTKKLSV